MGGLVQIVAFEKQLEGDPKVRQQALELASQGDFDFGADGRVRVRDPQRKAVRHAAVQIVQRKRVFALGRAPPSAGDKRGQLPVGAGGLGRATRGEPARRRLAGGSRPPRRRMPRRAGTRPRR